MYYLPLIITYSTVYFLLSVIEEVVQIFVKYLEITVTVIQAFDRNVFIMLCTHILCMYGLRLVQVVTVSYVRL